MIVVVKLLRHIGQNIQSVPAPGEFPDKFHRPRKLIEHIHYLFDFAVRLVLRTVFRLRHTFGNLLQSSLPAVEPFPEFGERPVALQKVEPLPEFGKRTVALQKGKPLHLVPLHAVTATEDYSAQIENHTLYHASN